MKPVVNENISPEIKQEILDISNNFWKALAERNIEKRFLYCAECVTFIGTGLHEKASNKAEYIAINKKGVEQYPNAFRIDILWQRVSSIGPVAWVENEVEWTQIINEREEKQLIRNTVVMNRSRDKWWIVHVHGSLPDFRLSGQNYITNAETIKINRELESEVYQRTRELNQTLENLKATQTQLIQREKMASLG